MNSAYSSGSPLVLRQTHYRGTSTSDRNYHATQVVVESHRDASSQVDAVVFSDGTASASGQDQVSWRERFVQDSAIHHSERRDEGQSRSGYGVG